MGARWIGWVIGGVAGVASGLLVQSQLSRIDSGPTQGNKKTPAATKQTKPGPKAPPVPRAREEGRLYRLAEWYSSLALQATEARVAELAEPREKAIAEKLTTVGEKRGFKFSGVRCGSKTCLARARFKSYAAAVTGFQYLIEAQVGIGSSARTLLPEPDNPRIPYVASVLFEWHPDAQPRADNAQQPVPDGRP